MLSLASDPFCVSLENLTENKITIIEEKKKEKAIINCPVKKENITITKFIKMNVVITLLNLFYFLQTIIYLIHKQNLLFDFSYSQCILYIIRVEC